MSPPPGFTLLPRGVRCRGCMNLWSEPPGDFWCCNEAVASRLTREHEIAAVYLFPNGMVMAFDRSGDQMPQYQGPHHEVIEKIREVYSGQIEGATWRPWPVAEAWAPPRRKRPPTVSRLIAALVVAIGLGAALSAGWLIWQGPHCRPVPARGYYTPLAAMLCGRQ